MWVRTRNLVSYYNACKSIFNTKKKMTHFSGHNDAKYLGSTGFLPAFQTYLCRWNNSCHDYTNPSDEFNNAFVFLYLFVCLFLRFSLKIMGRIVKFFK